MDYQKMDEQFVLESAIDGNRAAVERLGELHDINYFIDKECDTDIRIMTANLLYAKWDGEDPELTKYPMRMKRTAECINLYMPDFVGMQEARLMMREKLNEHLDSVYKYVEFIPPKRNAEWFPILYRTDRWAVVAAGTGEYTECIHPWGYVWTTFQCAEGGNKKITVMNLHYTLPNYEDIDLTWGEFRNDLAKEINAFARKHIADNPETPIVITGDYNTHRDSELYNTMVKDIQMESAGLVTDNSNMSEHHNRSTLDHITITTDLVDIVCHRCLDYYPNRAMSDHHYYFADLRKK